MTNDQLRLNCKLLKATQGNKYKELAELLGIKQDSFYSFLRGRFDLSAQNQEHLEYILNTLQE